MKLLGISALLAVVHCAAADDSTALNISITRQFPPPARVNEPYSWTFANDTFTSDISYSLSFTIDDQSTWLNLNSSGKTFYGTPNTSDIGNPRIQLLATDTDGDTAAETFTFVVTDTPAPVLKIPLSLQISNTSLGASAVSSSSSLHVYPNQPFQWQIANDTFTSSDSSLIFHAIQTSLDPLPSWLSFSSEQRTFRGRPPPANGPYSLGIQVVASEADNPPYTGGTSDSFQLVVSDHQLAVGAAGPTVLSAAMGQNLVFNVLSDVAIDNTTVGNGNISRVMVDTTNTPWLTFDYNTNILSGQPSNFSATTSVVTVSYSDTFNDTVTQTILIQISHDPFTQTALPTQYVQPNASFTFSYLPYLMSTAKDYTFSLTVSQTQLAGYFTLDTSKAAITGSIPADYSALNASLIISAFNPVTRGLSNAFLYVVLASNATIAVPPPDMEVPPSNRSLGYAVIATAIIAGLAAIGLLVLLTRTYLRKRRQTPTPQMIFMGSPTKSRHGSRHSSQQRVYQPPQFRAAYVLGEDGNSLHPDEGERVDRIMTPSDRIRRAYVETHGLGTHDPEQDPEAMLHIFATGDPDLSRYHEARGRTVSADVSLPQPGSPNLRNGSVASISEPDEDLYDADPKGKRPMSWQGNNPGMQQMLAIPAQPPTAVYFQRSRSDDTMIINGGQTNSLGGRSNSTSTSFQSASTDSFSGFVDASGQRVYLSHGGAVVPRDSADSSDPNVNGLRKLLQNKPDNIDIGTSAPPLRHKMPFSKSDIARAKLVNFDSVKAVSPTFAAVQWQARAARITTASEDASSRGSTSTAGHRIPSPQLTNSSTFDELTASPASIFDRNNARPIGMPTIALLSDPSKIATPSKSKEVGSPKATSAAVFFSPKIHDIPPPPLHFPEAAAVVAAQQRPRVPSPTRQPKQQLLLIEACEPFHYSVNSPHRGAQEVLSPTPYTEFVARSHPDRGPLPEWLHFESATLEFWGIPYFENRGRTTISVVERWIGTGIIQTTIGRQNRAALGLSNDEQVDRSTGFGDERVVAQFSIEVFSSEDGDTRRQYRDEEFRIVTF